MTNVLLTIIAAELFFIWMRAIRIDRSTYKRLPDDGIRMTSFDPQSDAAKHGLYERG
jgi:hypothetical protein